MAATYVGAVQGSGNAAGMSLNFTSLSVQANDLILVEIVHSDVSGGDTSSNGFTRRTAAAGLGAGTSSESWGYEKIAVGGEGTVSWTFDHAGGTGCGGIGLVFRDWNHAGGLSGLVYAEAVNATAVTTVTSGAITTPAADYLLVATYCVDASAAGNYDPPPTGMTERIDAEGLTGTFLALAGYTEVLASAVTNATRTGTYNAAFRQGSHAWAIPPAAAAGAKSLPLLNRTARNPLLRR